MQYRKFGNTGINISALGFGAMRLPEYEKEGQWFVDEEESVKVIHRAFELGVNYIDTAYGYCHGSSEYTVGKALKGYRDKVYLSTKMPTPSVQKEGDYTRFLEEQLRKLDVEYIDFYHFHGLNKDRWDNIVQKFNLMAEAERAKQQGLIKHISFSFHDKPEVMKELADTGLFETVLCQYNLLDRSNEEAIAHARQKGLGVIIMGPVGGGRLAAPSGIISEFMGGKAKSTPEVALRFVLGNENVCCALSGMNSLDMVEENARVASIEKPLDESDWQRINAMLDETKRLSELYCTGCDYCMPCPSNIRIPYIFRLMNYSRVYGLDEYARSQFAKLGETSSSGQSPSACVECGACETKCPQGIKIREQLKQTLKVLGG